MISRRFRKLILESTPEQTVTAVLLWEWPDTVARSYESVPALPDVKKPLLERFASEHKFLVRDFESLPSAVIIGPACEWRRLIEADDSELNASNVTLDVNFEIPLVKPDGT